MNALDVVILVPLLWGLYRGITKGFIIQLASLVALGLGIFAAIKLSDKVAAMIKENVEASTSWLPLIAFAVVFITTVVLVFLLANFLEKVLKLAALGWLNKLMGAIFGLAKYLLLLSGVLFLLQISEKHFSLIPPKIKEGSLLYQPVAKIIPAAMRFGAFSFPAK